MPKLNRKQVSWAIKYAVIINVTILRLTSALIQAHYYTELDNLLTTAVHCLYCNPSYYPHGLLWYAIMIPLAYFVNPHIVLMEFAMIDMAILIIIIKHNVFIPYLFVSFVSFAVIPQNMPILWLMLLGLDSTAALGLSIIAKLPVGAPASVWNFIFSTSLHIVTNFQDDYGLLVFLWLYIFIYNLRFDLIRGWAKLRK